jgi:hypothetical protein
VKLDGFLLFRWFKESYVAGEIIYKEDTKGVDGPDFRRLVGEERSPARSSPSSVIGVVVPWLFGY